MLRKIMTFLQSILLFLYFLSTAAFADEVILKIESIAESFIVSFTQEDLLALPQISFDTSTIWSEGVDRYSGPSLQAVLDAAGMERKNLRIYALNDYNVNFPAAKIESSAPILVNKINGTVISARNKGPLWLLFPFDDDDKYKTEVNFALSVWQVEKIEVMVD